MKTLYAVALLVLLAGCRAPVSELLQSESGTAVSYSYELDYQVWLPDGYEAEPERTYPLLVWFHGGGENEYGWGREGRIGEIVHNRVASGELQPFVVVSPSAGMLEPVLLNYETILIQQVIPEVRKKYRVNGVTVAFGHSMGGLSALMVSMRHPELFDAVVAASPFVFDTSPWDAEEQQEAYDRDYPGRFNSRWRGDIGKYFESEEGFRRSDPFSIARSGRTLPFDLLITCGTEDTLGLFPHNERLHNALAEAGVEHTWLVQKGVGHGTVEDPRLMNWLNERASVTAH